MHPVSTGRGNFQQSPPLPQPGTVPTPPEPSLCAAPWIPMLQGYSTPGVVTGWGGLGRRRSGSGWKIVTIRLSQYLEEKNCR